MTSNTIYSILASKQHNPHYLQRYVKFIELCCAKNLINAPTYVEKHHICPKAASMFPQYKSFTVNRWNLAKLTNRQHFIAHYLLWKVYNNSATMYSFWRFNKNVSKLTSKTYAVLKNAYLESIRGENNYWFGTTGPMRGKSHTVKARKAISFAVKGVKNPFYGKQHSAETKAQISLKCTLNNPMRGTKGYWFGKNHVEETKAKMRGPRSKQIVTICPYCNKTGGASAMKRYHFDNCKAR